MCSHAIPVGYQGILQEHLSLSEERRDGLRQLSILGCALGALLGDLIVVSRCNKTDSDQLATKWGAYPICNTLASSRNMIGAVKLLDVPWTSSTEKLFLGNTSSNKFNTKEAYWYLYIYLYSFVLLGLVRTIELQDLRGLTAHEWPRNVFGIKRWFARLAAAILRLKAPKNGDPNQTQPKANQSEPQSWQPYNL